jgi:hypothetical protein
VSPELHIMIAHVTVDGGPPLAVIERVKIGGGIQTVTVDGVAEDRVHPSFYRYHVRLLSPDRMIPDQLLETKSYDEAVELALKYGDKRVEHAARVDQLAADLKI